MKKRIIFLSALVVSLVSLVIISWNHNNRLNTLEEKVFNSNDTIQLELRQTVYSKTPEEGLRDALYDLGIIEPDIVYAQAILETGHFNSELCTKKNNLFGLYNSKKGEYFEFEHWYDSVIAYRDYIQCKYSGGDYYVFLQEIHYASDTDYIIKLKEIVKKCKEKKY